MADKAEDRLRNFNGFEVPRYTPIPDAILDGLLDVLTGGELKVLLYIARHTLGYKKQADELSAKQIAEGITKRNGEPVDHGTGLSIRQVRRTVTRLEELGLIEVTREKDVEEVHARNVYALRVVPEAKQDGSGGSDTHVTTLVTPMSLPLVTPMSLGVVTPTSPPKNRRSRSETQESLSSNEDALATEFFNRIGETMPSKKRRERALGIIHELTAEGFTADAIREACRLAGERGARGPDLLPYLIGEAHSLVETQTAQKVKQAQVVAATEKEQQEAADRHEEGIALVEALAPEERTRLEAQARTTLGLDPDRHKGPASQAVITGWIMTRLRDGGAS